MSQGFPESFSHLREAAFHAADRAWTGIGHFFVCQSILALAWAQIYTASPAPFLILRPYVLLAVSIAGVVMGLQWALLGTRMWQYHLEYAERLARVYRDFRDSEQGPGARAWVEVDTVIDSYWRDNAEFDWLKKWSGNQWVLFITPLFLSLIHLMMLVVIVWTLGEWGPFVAIVLAVATCIAFAVAWKICEGALSKAVFHG